MTTATAGGDERASTGSSGNDALLIFERAPESIDPETFRVSDSLYAFTFNVGADLTCYVTDTGQTIACEAKEPSETIASTTHYSKGWLIVGAEGATDAPQDWFPKPEHELKEVTQTDFGPIRCVRFLDAENLVNGLECVFTEESDSPGLRIHIGENGTSYPDWREDS